MKRASPGRVAIQVCLLLAASTAALAFSACSSEDETTQTVTGVLSVAYNPSPVSWGAGPGSITICQASANVWRFNEVLSESAGSAISITSVVNTRDGTAQPATVSTISVPARGSFTLARELCFPTSTQHIVQSTFTGTDAAGHAINLIGPSLVLSAR